jgi:hypothetical protein
VSQGVESHPISMRSEFETSDADRPKDFKYVTKHQSTEISKLLIDSSAVRKSTEDRKLQEVKNDHK